MCLVTNQKEAIITSEDMIVYKIMYISDNGNVVSPYHSCIWHPRELKKVGLCVELVYGDDAIYFDNRVEEFYGLYESDEKFTMVSLGFHAALTSERLGTLFAFNHRVLEFLIPAGSLIFTDETGLIVSDQMMLL